MAMEPVPLGFGDGLDAALFSSLWALQEEMQMLPPESVEELKQSLVATKLELEATREELRKKEQNIAKFAVLVRQVARERDDARQQVQQLLLAGSKQQQQQQAAHGAAAAAGLVTSSVTDSDCSLVSSPVDPFFDPVTSSDRRCAKLASPPPPPPPAATAKQQQQPPQQQCPADAVIDMLAMKRPLPPRGRLLQSVMEAGPLLQNLLVAGPLPRWRNPPPLHPLDTLPVGGGGGGYVSAPPAPPLPPTPLGGYVLPSTANSCMTRPIPMAATTTTNCSPGYAAKRHRMH